MNKYPSNTTAWLPNALVMNDKGGKCNVTYNLKSVDNIRRTSIETVNHFLGRLMYG